MFFDHSLMKLDISNWEIWETYRYVEIKQCIKPPVGKEEITKKIRKYSQVIGNDNDHHTMVVKVVTLLNPT